MRIEMRSMVILSGSSRCTIDTLAVSQPMGKRRSGRCGRPRKVSIGDDPLGTTGIIRESMVLFENRVIKPIVSGLSWVLIGIGGMSFWVGGRALHEFAGMDRTIAELEGLAGAAVLIALGAGLRAVAGLPLTKRSRSTE